MLRCPSLIKMNEPSRSYLLSDYICGVKAVFLCFYCFLNPACLSERFMVTSCRFLQEVISYKLTYVAYKSQDRNQEIQPSFLLRAFFLASVTVAHYKLHLQQFVFLFTYAECSFF